MARGYATIPAKPRPLRPEDARARKGLAQAISGLRCAVTGEDKVIVMPQSPAQLPPHQIERSQELGLNVATITLRVPNPGGTAAMATGKITIGKVKPGATHIQRARLDAIERIAKQSRGSGQILPISATAPEWSTACSRWRSAPESSATAPREPGSGRRVGAAVW